ncbi:cupin domain-containing protein [Simiduia aestuariiviva]|uniref:50S ribosomal protein L16 3-hydroxylase n=1 Tax=Simiduia aestuariiviva TaxID=1510459 RepID=A0A839UP39_9GAMM|nr:cupin domain-containing protein [Simiduia aestuariiviva]MBB3168300.1 50S ribosomal protein L16 3-hydroxylase [Simiduia aestuariiviva]
MNPLTHLGDVALNAFFKEYWQKKPVVLRGVFPDWENPIGPDELAGLAMEEEVESRIVLEQDQGKPWQLRAGPFTEDDFNQLPPSGWSLLVQAVDHWVPEATALLDKFRFIPNWRIDDLMVSYAPEGASVGPHFDYYDVFLVQGFGRRRWQLGQKCDENSERVEQSPLNILKQFDTREEFVLEPGDVLYVPPQFAHWGIAEGECMTYSVGFRAPAHTEILDDYVAEICSELPAQLRYVDQNSASGTTPGHIDDHVITTLQAIIKSHVDQPEKLIRWFGKYMTEPKYLPDQGAPEVPDEEALSQAAADLQEHEGPLFQAPDARFAYRGNVLFANGVAYDCDSAVAQMIANQRSIHGWQALVTQRGVAALISQLVALDLLWFEDPVESDSESN